ncbi:MAG: hypothetical protein WCP60_10245 [bacterium]
MNKHIHSLLICALTFAAALYADVTPHALFCNHAVLQRDKPIPVWGQAAPGEKVTVRLADKIAETTVAGADGRWSVRLPAQDEVLGRELAAKLGAKAAEVEPKVDNIQKRRGLEKENHWALRGTLDGENSPDAEATNLMQFIDYDYLYRWLNEGQRAQIRRIIAKMTAGKSSNFMEVPDHFMINNHLSFGMGYFDSNSPS